MSPEEVLREIRDELKAIKKELKVVARLEERVGYHHETLGRFGNNIDSCASDVSEIKIALARSKTSTVDIQSLIKWMGGLIAAFMIAVYLNGSKPAHGTVLNKEQKITKHEMVIKEGKK